MTVVFQQMNITDELLNEEPTISNPCQIFWNQILRKLPNVLPPILPWNGRNRTGSFDCVPSFLNQFLKSLWVFFHLNSFSLLCQPQLTYFSPVSHFYNVRKPLVFWRFQRVWKYDTGLKWVKAGMSEKDGLKWIITMIFSQISLKLVGQNKTRKGGRVIHLKKLWYVSEKLFIWSEQWQRQGREEKEREKKKEQVMNRYQLRNTKTYSEPWLKSLFSNI